MVAHQVGQVLLFGRASGQTVDHAVAIGFVAILAELELAHHLRERNLDAHDGAQQVLHEIFGCVGHGPGLGTGRFVMAGQAAHQCMQAVGKAFQHALFGDDAASRVAVTDQYAFEFHAQAYAPSRDYDGRWGHFDFRKHFYGRVGDFDSKEEFECACGLDIQAQQGRIQFWVRNLVRREGSSFFLQKADGRFYPDFLCQLPGAADQVGPILAVEYMGQRAG